MADYYVKEPALQKSKHLNPVRCALLCYFVQVHAHPSDPLLRPPKIPHNSIAHFALANVWIVGVEERCVVPEDFFEQNVLLTVSACGYQLLLVAAGLVVHTCFGYTHDLLAETWVQDPTLGVVPQWNLYATKHRSMPNIRCLPMKPVRIHTKHTAMHMQNQSQN